MTYGQDFLVRQESLGLLDFLELLERLDLKVRFDISY